MSEIQSDTLNLKESFEKADFLGRTALVLSTWFCIGLMPKAPGTFGTLAAIPLVFVLTSLRTFYGALLLILFVLMSIWASGVAQKYMGRDDPPAVVLDEVAGFLVAMFLVPLTWFSLFSGFILFRLFDIIKPFPVNRCEALKGGLGIVMDDFAAGIIANLFLRIVLVFYAG